LPGIDSFTQQAMQMVSSSKVRDAFDLSQEPPDARARYGKFCESFLYARRIVEAGVPVVTLKVGDWDTHDTISGTCASSCRSSTRAFTR
jgi:hypothetical protein